ncbi:virulence RhuM family protein [Marinimicrobium alkaliphilum]|uniref:virulence RhuM family protein n=1 Tax=Marinimicrobium alkaliphilum TaxID=2202654 RepID=UPI0018E0927A|nr:RhuM family protein [Marinimicrobium alkaliphilum]
MTEQQIRIFTTSDGRAQLEVALDRETVWLNQNQMATLFDTSTDNVGLHLKNIYREGELEEASTTEDFSVVRQEGKRQVQRRIKHYSLDAIISVGYRVSSRRATQFRQWATQTLKDHLVQGYTLNQRRLTERGIEFEQAVELLGRTLSNQGLASPEGEAVTSVISDYARSWSLLQGYDEQALSEVSTGQPGMHAISLENALSAIPW